MDLDRSIIKSNPFFNLLDEQDFSRILQSCTLVNLNPKEVLFHEGDFSDAFYIVKQGAIQITTINSNGETVFLARVGADGFFGEQAFSPSFSPRRRAKAAAQIETTLYKFPRNVLLSLKRVDPKFQTFLQEKGSQYIKEKLQKLTNSFHGSSYHLVELMKEEKFYPKRAVIFYQEDVANRAYILVSGEVELHCYGHENKIEQIVNIGPGQMFGVEGLDKDKTYHATAVAKLDANMLIIDSSQYHKMAEDHPLLKNLGDHFTNQFAFKAKGKIIQFHSEYLDMPATTSIISLDAGREVICQQVAGAEIFLASITNIPITKEIKYIHDERYYRTLSLSDNKIVGLLDYGMWEDRDRLFELIINGDEISEKNLQEFETTGHLTSRHIEKSESDLVCKCMRVSRGEINHLIVTKKADFAGIMQQTGAGTVCGGCRPSILEMLGTNAWSSCAVSQVVDHNPDIKSFRLTPLQGDILKYHPGQYLVIKVNIDNEWVQRNYTLTSIPEQSYYEITVKKETKGLFSSWLFENHNKDLIVYVAGPYGQFTLDQAKEQPVVCFMGGIGITPAVAFTRSLISSNKKQQIYIDYSASQVEQFILMDEFADIERKHKNVTINHRVTGVYGKVTEQEIRNIISSIEGCHVYICGPKGLEKLVTETFNQMNLEPERLHAEQFFHAGAPENVTQTISL